MPLREFHIGKQVLDRFCVAGINYQKADAATRGMFSVTASQLELIVANAKQKNITSLMVVSTCNRTEIYGYADSPMDLIDLLTEQTKGSKGEFFQFGYIKNGEPALNHLYQVAAGLDSQILGDYEILGQLKRAFELSKTQGVIGPVMDRTLNYVFQASKKIKTTTALSNGTVSVSFAAIELLKALPNVGDKKILIIGAGKFGANVCKNIYAYIPTVTVTIMNRTDDTAKAIAAISGANFERYANKQVAIKNNDIIIVCTNASEPTITAEHIDGAEQKLILDLSVPANVHHEIKKDNKADVIDIDEISNRILDKTLAKRRDEVPKAEAIINGYKNDFVDWLKNYHYSLHLKVWKDKLKEIDKMHTQVCEFYNDKDLIDETERVVRAQKAVKQLAVNLKVKNDKGCQFINLINDYLQASY